MGIKKCIAIIKSLGFFGVIKVAKDLLLCWDDLIWAKFFFKRLSIQDKWVFFQSGGDFNDNTRALYEYMVANFDEQYRYIWLVSDISKYPNTSNTTFVSSKPKPLLGQKIRWYYASRAKYLFFTHDGWYRNSRSGQICINLWHGIAIKGKKGEYIFKNSFEYTIVTSDFFKLSQARFIGCDQDKVISLGYPRNDLLFENTAREKVTDLLSREDDQRIVIWMPTYRSSIKKGLNEKYFVSSTGLPLLKDKKELLELDSFLENTGLKVVIKIHRLQRQNKVFKESLKNIVFLNDDLLEAYNLQLYELLANTDALITDYSSVYIDYLLKDNPIGFILDDYQSYKKSRGFMFDDPIKLMPGHHIFSKEDLFSFLNDIKNSIDCYALERSKAIKLMHTYPDAKSSQRIVQFLKTKE